MPELPEVEMIRQTLEPQLKGLHIKNVMVSRPEVVAQPSAGEFHQRLIGQKICGMGRRGKFLKICFESGDTVILHLRMTGGLLITPADYFVEKHTHVTFHLSDGRELRFSDPRRFGRFWLLNSGEEDTYSGVYKLGLEPFDERFTDKYLRDSYGDRRKTIKECLLEQGIVTGIGNIYSDEILFTAKIHPRRPANSLSVKEWKLLTETIQERLSFFIEKNRISPEDYLEGKGKEYRNTPFLQVYGHQGEECPVCREVLCRTVIGGRSSVFCPKCQREKKTRQARMNQGTGKGKR